LDSESQSRVPIGISHIIIHTDHTLATTIFDPLRYALNNNLVLNEPEADFAFVQDIVVASDVISTLDRTGGPHHLTLAASSNIHLMAANDIGLYANSNRALRMFSAADEIINVTLSNDGSALVTAGSNRTVVVRPTDPLQTVRLGSFRTLDSASVGSKFQDITTLNNLGVRVLKNLTAAEPVTVNSTMHVASRVTMGENLVVEGDIMTRGHIFTPQLKFWRDNNATGERVGFGLHINTSNQLEMYKYVAASNGTSTMKRVATFGHSSFDTSATADLSDAQWSTMGALLSNTTINPGTGGGYFSLNAGMDIYTMANLGLGTSNPAFPLHVVGTARCDTLDAEVVLSRGGVQASCDARLKSNIVALSPETCLQDILQLRPRAYTMAEQRGLGFVAQEVKEVIPEAVSVRSDARTSIPDFHFLDLQPIITKLVGAVQALASSRAADVV